ncbi:myosin heavy chain, clone 203-like isoform X1 [Periplaneta americana]|uniref:myosin heavy chain, clone 203-like isoform X1 n=1 Tax=Periplaneta americana TaxID=6978 RepID=UPI0037E75040
MMWIFLFAVISITLFLMVMYKHNKEELRNNVLGGRSSPEYCEKTSEVQKKEPGESLETQLQTLVDKLAEKESLLRVSRDKITQAEEKINSLQSSSSEIQDQYKMIMSELKQELAKTEVQCTDLHRQIDYITKRREELKNEVLKEQQTYQEILDCLCKELLSREESCKASRTDTVSTNNEEEAETVHQEGIEV